MTTDEPTSFHKAPNSREHRIRLIHVARRELSLDEDDYRGILVKLTGKNSCSEMAKWELDEVLDHLKRLGFRVKPRCPQTRPLADDDRSKKIRRLWLDLYEANAIKDPSERALGSFIKRMTGIDALQWIDSQQASNVIEGLKKWLDRF